MKNIILFYLFLIFSVASFGQVNNQPLPTDSKALLTSKYNGGTYDYIRYFLPEKVFYITVIFTLSNEKLVTKKGKIVFDTTKISIEDPITIEGKIFPSDYVYGLDPNKLSCGGRTYSLEVGFDEQGGGFLNGINSSQEPVTSDIIKGTASIIGSVLKASTTIFGVSALAVVDDVEPVKTIQKVTEKMLVKIPSDGRKVTETISINKASYNNAKVPEVQIVFEKKSKDLKPIEVSENTVAPGVYYRVPAIYSLTAIITNNLFAPINKVIEDYVYVPQSGTLSFVPIPLRKGKKTIVISFNSTTGNLSKYSIKKESTVKASMEQVNTSIGEISAGIKELKAANIDKEAKDIKNEIELIKLQKELSDLKKENN